MKIVQSYWSKPVHRNSVSNTKSQGKAFAGWRQTDFHFMSWTLSCLNLRKFYENVELVTDEVGYRYLIEKLKLPYSSVRVELDCINTYPSSLWAIGKLYTYGIQNEPFIHVDGDVYIWGKFNAEIESSGLLAQNKDIVNGHYIAGYSRLKDLKFSFPEILAASPDEIRSLQGSNAGIIGGNNFDFFKDFSKKSFEFIDKNIHLTSNLSDTESTWFALIYEQLLFSLLAKKNEVDINYLFSEDEFNAIDVSAFSNKYDIKYVHLLGNTKKYLEHCKEIYGLLLLEDPKYLNNVSSI